jgi:hypothetical protein
MRALLAGALLAILWPTTIRADGAVPDVEWRATAVVAHDVASGWKHPTIFASECVLGPHYGPLYIGGACTTQGNGFGGGVALATYVSRGRVPKLGFLRGLVVQFGYRQEQFGDSTRRSLYFGVGAAR